MAPWFQNSASPPDDAAIELHVFDTSGAVITKAEVSFLNTSTHKEIKATTNDAGDPLLTQLPPGSYIVSVYASGFSARQKTISVEAKKTAKLDITLELGLMGEVVEVRQSFLSKIRHKLF